MKFNESFDSINEALPRMLNIIHNAGTVIPSRAGETKEITHVGISLHDPRRREILLPNRKPNLAAQIVETVWVLTGKNDVETLAHYLPRAADFSDDGFTWRAGYGARLRKWEGRSDRDGDLEWTDQIAWVVEHLKKDPGSRRAVLSIWDPEIDTADGVKDIPCNDWLSFLIRDGHLDLHVAVRSNDVIWGWSGINQFEWSVLLEVVAGLVGVKVGSLHFSTTSFHLYDRHYTKAEKIVENAYPLPPQNLNVIRFDLSALPTPDMAGLDKTIEAWWIIEQMIREGNCPDGVVNGFTEPLMRAWLRVLQWWWTGEREYLAPLEGTTLERGATYSVQPKREAPRYVPSVFMEGLCRLHLQKEAAYGGSWKKRGELFSILPNVGRKVDRIEGGETDDETSADTAGDLFVYLAKYLTWLSDDAEGARGDDQRSESAEHANAIMECVEADEAWPPRVEDVDMWKGDLVRMFEDLLVLAEEKNPERQALVNMMLPLAYRLARTLWERENPLLDMSEYAEEYMGADHE